MEKVLLTQCKGLTLRKQMSPQHRLGNQEDVERVSSFLPPVAADLSSSQRYVAWMLAHEGLVALELPSLGELSGKVLRRDHRNALLSSGGAAGGAARGSQRAAYELALALLSTHRQLLTTRRVNWDGPQEPKAREMPAETSRAGQAVLLVSAGISLEGIFSFVRSAVQANAGHENQI